MKIMKITVKYIEIEHVINMEKSRNSIKIVRMVKTKSTVPYWSRLELRKFSA